MNILKFLYLGYFGTFSQRFLRWWWMPWFGCLHQKVASRTRTVTIPLHWPHLELCAPFWAPHNKGDHWGAGACPGKGSRAREGFGAQVWWGVHEGVCSVQPGEKNTKRNQLPERCRVGVSSPKWDRGNGLRLHQERCRLGIRKNFFIRRAVYHWNRLSREMDMEMVESPSEDRMWHLRTQFSAGLGSTGLRVGLHDLKRLFQPKCFCDIQK